MQSKLLASVVACVAGAGLCGCASVARGTSEAWCSIPIHRGPRCGPSLIILVAALARSKTGALNPHRTMLRMSARQLFPDRPASHLAPRRSREIKNWL